MVRHRQILKVCRDTDHREGIRADREAGFFCKKFREKLGWRWMDNDTGGLGIDRTNNSYFDLGSSIRS